MSHSRRTLSKLRTTAEISPHTRQPIALPAAEDLDRWLLVAFGRGLDESVTATRLERI